MGYSHEELAEALDKPTAARKAVHRALEARLDRRTNRWKTSDSSSLGGGVRLNRRR
jgi:hypothetical protein